MRDDVYRVAWWELEWKKESGLHWSLDKGLVGPEPGRVVELGPAILLRHERIHQPLPSWCNNQSITCYLCRTPETSRLENIFRACSSIPPPPTATPVPAPLEKTASCLQGRRYSSRYRIACPRSGRGQKLRAGRSSSSATAVLARQV